MVCILWLGPVSYGQNFSHRFITFCNKWDTVQVIMCLMNIKVKTLYVVWKPSADSQVDSHEATDQQTET